MSDEPVLISVERCVATLTMNRPASLNALDEGLRSGLVEKLDHVSRDPSVRVVVLTGAGRGFCAGGDIKKMVELKKNHHSVAFRAFLEGGSELVRGIRSLPKPVVACVNGPAAGAGMNLALACDLRIASDQATFAEAFVRIGLHPDWGGTFFLPRMVGTGRALEMFFLGETISAAEAGRLGLVNQVVPHGQLNEETRKLAERLVAAPALPVSLMKQAFYKNLETQLDTMMEYEVEAQMKCFESEDFEEGLRAYLEKRQPKFEGS